MFAAKWHPFKAPAVTVGAREKSLIKEFKIPEAPTSLASPGDVRTAGCHSPHFFLSDDITADRCQSAARILYQRAGHHIHTDIRWLTSSVNSP